MIQQIFSIPISFLNFSNFFFLQIYKVPVSGGPSDVQVFAAKPPKISGGGYGDLEFGPDGNLYVTSWLQEDVLVFNPLGGFERRLNVKKLNEPVSISFHQDKVWPHLLFSFKGSSSSFSFFLFPFPFYKRLTFRSQCTGKSSSLSSRATASPARGPLRSQARFSTPSSHTLHGDAAHLPLTTTLLWKRPRTAASCERT